MTIYGKSGSCVDNYANINGIPFISVPDDVLTPVSDSGCVVDNEKGYIYGLPSGTTKTEFEQCIQLKNGYDIGYNADDFGTGTEVYVISGTSGSAGVVSVAADGVVVESFTIIIIGDINGDGLITVIDALLALQKSNEAIALSPAQTFAGDVSNNGLISPLDALKILHFASGMITQF